MLIGMDGEKVQRESVLSARLDNDDDDQLTMS